MSNSIAPGSSADVNVKVTALTTNPNVPVTYKTIILKKNIVNGVNTLTQEMMSAQNTKYVVKYDYVLGENITVPTNCILEFDGGSVSGDSTINFNGCQVCGLPNILCLYDGDIKNTTLNVTWFGCDSSGNEDCSVKLGQLFNKYPSKQIIFPKGEFLIANQISMPRSTFIKGTGIDSVLKLTYEGFAFVYEHISGSSNDFLTIEISDITVRGTYPSWYDENPQYTNSSFLKTEVGTYTYRAVFSNLKISKVKYGLQINKAYWSRFETIHFYDYYAALYLSEANSSSITNCGFRGGRNSAITFDASTDNMGAGTGVNISGNDFSGNNYCGILVLNLLGNAFICGNYFECEPGKQIIVGKQGDSSINGVATMQSCTICSNSGLQVDINKLRGITVYGKYINNFSDCAVYFETGSDGGYNRGLIQHDSGVSHYIHGIYNFTEIFKGFKKWYDSKVKTYEYKDIILPPNTFVALEEDGITLFKFLYFRAPVANVQFFVKGGPTGYIIGSDEGGNPPMDDEIALWNGDFDYNGTGINIIVGVMNTSNETIITDVRFKYFYNYWATT